MRCLCVSVCPSRSWVASKRIKISLNFFHHRVANHSMFSVPNGMAIFRREPLNGGVECRWGTQKTRFWTNIWLRCIQVSSVVNRTSREVWKIKPRRTAASVERRAEHSTTTKCLWRDRRYTPETEVEPPPGHNPLGHNPVFYCRKTSWNRTRWVFLLKTDTNPYSWPYPTHEAGLDTNRPTKGSKLGGLWPRGVCPGGFGRTPPETIGDSRTELNEILCTSNLRCIQHDWILTSYILSDRV